jgi:glycosyltransferase involved in cell wall biosynthesis
MRSPASEMKSQLRLLLPSTFYPPYSFGGDAIYVWRLANALAADGHLVDVVHCADSYELLAGTRPIGPSLASHRNVSIHPLRSRPRALASVAAHQSGLPLGRGHQIARAMSGKEYDVIHFNNVSMFGPGILNLNSTPRTVKLYTMLEYWLVCERHTLWKFNVRNCESAQCFQCVIRARRPPQLWRSTGLLDRMASKIDRFLAPSAAVARIHKKRGFRHPVQRLPLFTELPSAEVFEGAPRPIDKPYFLFVGRLELIKGIETLLSAWEHITGADLIIVGDGALTDQLKRRSAANERVHLVGNVSQPGLASFYRHAIAGIVPSLFEEPFGLTAIESLAHRTPVIAHSVGGLREIIEESGGGILYETSEELVAAMKNLLCNESLRDTLAERGYRACVERWSPEAHLRQYYRVIEEIAAAKACALKSTP